MDTDVSCCTPISKDSDHSDVMITSLLIMLVDYIMVLFTKDNYYDSINWYGLDYLVLIDFVLSFINVVICLIVTNSHSGKDPQKWEKIGRNLVFIYDSIKLVIYLYYLKELYDLYEHRTEFIDQFVEIPVFYLGSAILIAFKGTGFIGLYLISIFVVSNVLSFVIASKNEGKSISTPSDTSYLLSISRLEPESVIGSESPSDPSNPASPTSESPCCSNAAPVYDLLTRAWDVVWSRSFSFITSLFFIVLDLFIVIQFAHENLTNLIFVFSLDFLVSVANFYLVISDFVVSSSTSEKKKLSRGVDVFTIDITTFFFFFVSFFYSASLLNNGLPEAYLELVSSSISIPRNVSIRPNDDLMTLQKQTITLNGLNFMLNNFVTEIIQQVSAMAIPDFSTELDTPIGKINIAFDNINIETLQMDNHVPYYDEGVGIRISVTGAYLKIQLDFQYQMLTFPFTTDGGQLTLTANDAAFIFEVDIYEDNYRQALKVTEAKLSLGDFSLDLVGSSDILRTIVQVATPFIQESIEDAMDSMISVVVNDIINSFLSDVQTCIVLDSETAIDFRIPEDPVITSKYMTSSYSGFYYGSDSDLYVPTTQTDLPDILNNNDIQLFFEPDVLLSMFHTYRPRGTFEGIITQDDVPSSFPFDMNQSILLELFLPDSLPSSVLTLSSDSPIRVNYSMSADPVAEMMASAIAVNADYSVSFEVYDSSDDQWILAASMDIVSQIVAVPAVQYDPTAPKAVIGIIFVFDFYESNVTQIQSGVEIINEQLLSLFIDVLFSACVSIGMDDWAASIAYPMQPPPGVLYTDPIIWYDETWYGIFFTYVWQTDTTDVRRPFPPLSWGMGEENAGKLTVQQWVARQEAWRALRPINNTSDDDDICIQ
ncbi:BPI/LBP/Plunc family like protein [Aduncisulcus paluster]|uniref:BPI/LBP/Plunc family like protein n=1 Tax=Aduncisulcus paluster TaxID=2918883 RepID=A0ABQ5K382_9EUKA|nr:BPI/LBP/Plunc family like protein [Aduncisulcus paluster]